MLCLIFLLLSLSCKKFRLLPCWHAASNRWTLNNELPAKIVVYRDGVSEGQLHVVENYEVQQIYQSFAPFGEQYMPQVVVIVVQKRINTTICLNRDMPENPPSGTVLDHGVTNPNWCDFFLVSQHVRQGTVSPTHYVVLHNTTKLSPDHLQRLFYTNFYTMECFDFPCDRNIL
uniref:Piwi domain-containing protein n=1 Tax=Eptatretus burgeri TaxID=7764 RepID=A0A8C4NDD0_EPTBU